MAEEQSRCSKTLSGTRPPVVVSTGKAKIYRREHFRNAAWSGNRCPDRGETMVVRALNLGRQLAIGIRRIGSVA